MMGELTTGQIVMLFWVAFGKIPTVIAATAIGRTPFAAARKYVNAAPANTTQIAREWKGALITASDAVMIYVAIRTGLIHLAPSQLWTSVATIGAMLVWVEVWMYFSHLWMHKSQLLWAVHRHHHLSRIVQPTSALSFSLVEKLVFYSLAWVCGACVLSRVLPITFDGLVAWYTIYFVLSPLAHCNTVYFPELGIVPSPAVHALHHLRPDVNFGFYTTTFDRILGTYCRPDRSLAGSWMTGSPALESRLGRSTS